MMARNDVVSLDHTTNDTACKWMGWVCISKAVPSSLSNYHVAGLTRSL
jgi:hypothetical protein